MLSQAELRQFEAHLAANPEDEEFKALLAGFRQKIEANPLSITKPLYKEQEEVLESWTRYTLFCGGNRAGKSFIGILKDLIELLPREWIPEHLQKYKHLEPPARGRIVSPGRSTTQEVVIFDLLRSLCPPGALAGGSWESAFSKQNNMLSFQCGSWLQFLTSEQDISKHSGAALDFVHMDEEPAGDSGYGIFKENSMRLVSTNGKFWMTMTPTEGFTWSFDELYNNADLEHITVIRASMDKNPTLDNQAKQELLSGMTKEEVESRKEGRYVHFGGTVYPEFNSRHVIPAPTPEHVKQLDLVVGIDPGLEGTGVVWVGFDKDDVALTFAEIFGKDLTPDKVCPMIRDMNQRWGINPDHYVLDPSARNRDLVNAEQLEGAYMREGIFVMPGQNAREPGINQVKRRLQETPPALFVSEECTRLQWEIARYRREQKNDGSLDVVKRDDHCLDAWRYALMERVWGVMPEMKARRRPLDTPSFQPPFQDVPADDFEYIESSGPLGAYS